MVDIRIDTSALSYPEFLLPRHSSTVFDGAPAATVSLAPGVHHFQQNPTGVAALPFRVTESGTVTYDAGNDRFLAGGGRTRS